MPRVLWNLRRMLRFAWETDPGVTAAFYATAAIGALMPLCSALAMKALIDALVAHDGDGSTWRSLPAAMLGWLVAWNLANLVSGAVHFGLHTVYFDHLFRYRLQNELSRRLLWKLSHLDIAHFEDPPTQDLITKARETSLWRPPQFLQEVSQILTGSVTFLAAFAILLPYGAWLPVVLTAVTLPRIWYRKNQGKLQWSMYGSGAEDVRRLHVYAWILSEINSVRELRIFRAQRELLDRYAGLQQGVYELNVAPLKTFLWFHLTFPGLEVALQLVVLASQLPRVVDGGMTVGDFTLLASMIYSLHASAVGTFSKFGQLYEDSLFVDHYFDVLALPELIVDRPAAVTFPTVAPPRIEFRHVSFAYPNGPKVLDDVSFTIEPGERVALVGANGAGKSTLIKLLCRFYDVTEGEILVNGVDLRDLDREHWYRHLGTLFQNFMHYPFTVRENIVLGSADGPVDVDRLRTSARKSGALEFVDRLPKGFDQQLGRQFESGEELSVGQWQKLSMARAFYAEPPMLILDEPTSAIDAEAEAEIFRNLDREYEGKTVLVVSHRFSTVRNATQILVLEDGRITERGDHAALLATGGTYAELFLSQAQGYR